MYFQVKQLAKRGAQALCVLTVGLHIRMNGVGSIPQRLQLLRTQQHRRFHLVVASTMAKSMITVQMSRGTAVPTLLQVRLLKTQISLRIRAV